MGPDLLTGRTLFLLANGSIVPRRPTTPFPPYFIPFDWTPKPFVLRTPLPATPPHCDGTGFSTTFLPSVVPYSRPYMWLTVLLTSRSLLVTLQRFACRVLHLYRLTHPPFRCKLNYLSASPSFIWTTPLPQSPNSVIQLPDTPHIEAIASVTGYIPSPLPPDLLSSLQVSSPMAPSPLLPVTPPPLSPTSPAASALPAPLSPPQAPPTTLAAPSPPPPPPPPLAALSPPPQPPSPPTPPLIVQMKLEVSER